MKLDRNYILISILIILHIVGVFGISNENLRGLVLSLSFINLLIGFILIVLATFNQLKPLLFFFLIAFAIGFGAELIGVHTGLLFGDYWYGKNLGPKLADVPLIIGINWGILAVSSASFTETLKVNRWIKVVLNSTLMVLFDFVMEPIAMKSDFWSWTGGTIPMYNYTCWFFIAFIIQSIYLNFFKIQANIVFKSLFIIQFLFFIILNLI